MNDQTVCGTRSVGDRAKGLRPELHLNVSIGYVSQIERGTRQPSKKVLTAFAAALSLDSEDLS